MNKLNYTNIELEEFEIYNIEIERLRNFLAHPCSLYLFEHRNLMSALNILREYGKPSSLTIVDIKLVPSEYNLNQYSFSGICSLVDLIFKNNKITNYVDDLSNRNIFLKVYYLKDAIYNIPRLCLELIIWGRLNDNTLLYLSDILNNEVFEMTGSKGHLNHIENYRLYDLLNFLRPTLIAGQENFEDIPCLKSYNICRGQIEEMDCIHMMQVLKIDTTDLLNFKSQLIYENIQYDISAKEGNPEFTDENVEEIMKRILWYK